MSTLGSKLNPYIKDPNATLDYIVNWLPYLGVDTISTSAWTIPSGVTSPLQANSTTTATVWLSGGTVGTRYALTNRVTSAGGRTDDRTIYVKVKER